MVDIRGGEQFAAAARQLRAGVRRDLRSELQGGLGSAAGTLVRAAQQNARETLPRRGGYAARVADTTQFRVELHDSPRGPWLRITATGPDRRLDQTGRLRHPVYARGPRDKWAWARKEQRVRPGWFTRPMRDGVPDVRVELVMAVNRYLHRRR